MATDIATPVAAPHAPTTTAAPAPAGAGVVKPGYDYGKEFDYGLELILDGLAARLADQPTAGS
jgi:hypothetical protein